MEKGHSSGELMHADPRDVGWVALSQGDWEGAKAAFAESIAAGESPEALEGLGAADIDRRVQEARGKDDRHDIA